MQVETAVKLYWDQICKDIAISSEASAEIWSKLNNYFGEVGRFYHNINHVSDLLAMYEQYQSYITDHNAVVLAIFFHDVIYNPRSSTNEEDSVQLFEELLAEHISYPLRSKVTHYILATKHHAGFNSDDKDLKYFLDFDMGILGSSRHIYKEYAMNIRNEYQFIEKSQYCSKRAVVLTNFLSSSPFIYSTTEFLQEKEAEARSNIAWEIDILNASLLVE